MPLEEKSTVEAMLSEFEEGNEELLEMLSFCNCYGKATREQFRAIVLEIVQKPKYIKEILLSGRCYQILKSVDGILEFYKNRAPTAKTLINPFICDPKSDSERAVFRYLTRFVKSLSMHDLRLFLLNLIWFY